jgi:Holliday junction resolvase RusA-like endonuclease
MSAVTFVVPGQPQGKGRAKIVKIDGFSRMATPAKTLAYEGLVAHAANAALAGRPPLQGPVHVRMVVACQVPTSWSQKKQRAALNGAVFPTTKPDVDNVVKAVFDGCNGVLWKDDVQVVQLTLYKHYSESPHVECVAREIQPVSAEQSQRDLLGEPA